MLRLTAIAFSMLVALSANSVRAQWVGAAPPAPPEYAGSTVPYDRVIVPLLDAAERDLREGRAALARARIELALSSPLSGGSTLQVRAEGLRLLAVQQPNSDQATELEQVLEPLITAAQGNVDAANPQLALAQLDFALARLRADGPLARVARAMRDSAARSVAGSVAPIAAEPSYAVVPPGALLLSAVPEAAPPDPNRRGNGEIVELYISAAGAGVLTGFWIPYLATGGTTDSGSEAVAFPLSMVAGGGLLALAIAGLDSGPGLRSGVAPTISTGIQLGAGMGFLLIGALDRFLPGSSSSSTAERLTLPVGLALGGGLIGAAFAFGLEPTLAEARLVQATSLWGAGLGGLLGLGFAADVSTGFQIAVGGLGLGLLSSLVVASSGAAPSTRRLGLLTTGYSIGLATGALATGLTMWATNDFYRELLGGVGAGGAVAGLIIAAILTEGMDQQSSATSELPFTFDFAPAQGGGTLSIRGVF